MPGAVEEILRYHGPVRMATYRYTTEPVTVGGVTIPAGEIVLVGLQSANRDDDKFPHAAELDLHRDASGHLAFGHGTHYCLGATLGRMEAEIVLTALTHQFPNARLAYEDQLRGRPSVIIDGYPELIVDLG